MLIKKHYFVLFLLLFFFVIETAHSQVKLFSDTPVSNLGTNNNIGSANTSRNVAVDDKGNIFVVYANDTEVRIAKSINGGQSFLPSVLIGNANNVEPELNINSAGIIYIAWIENNNLFFTSSSDKGINFSTPRSIDNSISGDVHMSSFEENVYLINQSGQNLYSNTNNGLGNFNIISTGVSMVYADVLTDQNGIVYTPMDNPNLLLFESTNQGTSLTQTNINPSSLVYFSSYALSDGPCGTFIFVGGGEISPSETLGYKIDVKTGNATEITLGENLITSEGRTLYADNKGTLIDGYRDNIGNLIMNISSDQGTTFNTPIVIASGDSHNIARSPTTDNIIVTYQANGQIYLSVYSDVLKNIEIPTPNPPLSFCSNTSFDLPFELSGVFDANTLFSVSLSDEFGDFNNAIEIGTVSTNTNGVIRCNLPSSLTQSSLYRIQIESLNNCIQSNVITLTIGVAEISGPKEVCVTKTIQLTGSNFPITTMPWVSSNTNIATISDTGLVTGVASGITEISYNTNSNCIGTYTLEVFDLPNNTENVSLKECDDNSDGFSFFDLSDANSLIIDNPTDFIITYFNTIENAENNTIPIPNFNNYENKTANTDVVWARIESDKGCFKVSKIELNTNFPLEYEIIISDDSLNNNSITINILTQQSIDNEYSLLSGQNVLFDFQTSPIFEKLNVGTYTVLIRSKNACNIIQQEVSLLSFPKFFTPNNDGKNDFWQVKGITQSFYKSGKVSVFDRYGKPITVFTIYDIGWDGNYNGHILQSNDYWYSVELIDTKNSTRIKKGHFSLLRN